ncbi:MAG: phosphoadenylyl-sulfate reductase [Verrucomicrobiia bacterium]|jgi:phosphoadenosine phosphosulfate reductase
MSPSENITELNKLFEAAPTEDVLQWVWSKFGTRAAIGTSFQGAGLVVMHIAKSNGFDFPIFTIDTDLLFEETIELKEKLEKFFDIKIIVLKPELTLDKQAEIYGNALWKRDPDLCCTIRKVIPLQNHLATLDCWITGLRRQQSQTRAHINIVELYTFDEGVGKEIVKINPLANWTRQQVWDYIKKHHIPYNELHDRGYKSIGCKPCTAAVGEVENERAGRWIGFQKTECGIHTFLKKKC